VAVAEAAAEEAAAEAVAAAEGGKPELRMETRSSC